MPEKTALLLVSRSFAALLDNEHQTRFSPRYLNNRHHKGLITRTALCLLRNRREKSAWMINKMGVLAIHAQHYPTLANRLGRLWQAAIYHLKDKDQFFEAVEQMRRVNLYMTEWKRKTPQVPSDHPLDPILAETCAELDWPVSLVPATDRPKHTGSAPKAPRPSA